jgi:hypothetical protein
MQRLYSSSVVVRWSIMYGKNLKILNNAVVAYLKILSHYSPEETLVTKENVSEDCR